MPQETVYFRITLQDAQNYNPQFNPYEIAITKKVSWLIDFWDNPLCGQSRARQLIKQIAGLVDGRGGGRPNMAQAGGKNAAGIADALAAAKTALGA